MIDVLVKILEADTDSSTADAVFARNTNPKITSAAQIPFHLYMSLADMFSAFYTGSNWPTLVTPTYGAASSQANGIDLIYQVSESVTAGGNNDRDDTVGAEYAEVKILCKVDKPTPAQKWITGAADLRVRYLLDTLLRGKWAQLYPSVVTVGGKGPYLNPIGLDNTIDPNEPFICRYIQQDLLNSDVRTRISRFSLNYVRLF